MPCLDRPNNIVRPQGRHHPHDPAHGRALLRHQLPIFPPPVSPHLPGSSNTAIPALHSRRSPLGCARLPFTRARRWCCAWRVALTQMSEYARVFFFLFLFSSSFPPSRHRGFPSLGLSAGLLGIGQDPGQQPVSRRVSVRQGPAGTSRATDQNTKKENDVDSICAFARSLLHYCTAPCRTRCATCST